MAEALGVAASVITLAATAQGAAQLSKVIYKVVSTFKHARKEMGIIARELSEFSGSLQTLADSIDRYEAFCKPEFFDSTRAIVWGYHQVEADLKELINTDKTGKLLNMNWLMQKPKAKDLLKKVAGIKAALTLNLTILIFAKDQSIQPPTNSPTATRAASLPSRWRSVVETVVQANRQVIESAQSKDIEDPVQKNVHSEGRRTGLDIWKENSFDTATWLYHLVFGPSVLEPPYHAAVFDAGPQREDGLVSLRSKPRPSQTTASSVNREMIVWDSRTEPSYVVDKLLLAWTTLSPQQISLSTARSNGRKDWSDGIIELLDEAKKDIDKEATEGSEEVSSETDASDMGEDWNDRLTDFKRRRERLDLRQSEQPSESRPRVKFDQTTNTTPRAPRITLTSSKSASSHATTPTVYTVDSDDDVSARHVRRPRSSSPPSYKPVAEGKNSWRFVPVRSDSTSNKADKRKDSRARSASTKSVKRSPDIDPTVRHSETHHSNTRGQVKDESTRRTFAPAQDAQGTSRLNHEQPGFPEGHRYAHALYQQNSDPTVPPHVMSPHSNPFSVPFGNANPDYMAPPYVMAPRWDVFTDPYTGSLATGYPPPPPPPAPPVPVPDEPPISKIKDLFATQQDNLARLLREQTAMNGGLGSQHLSAVTKEYNTTVQELTRSLSEEKEARKRIEEEAASTRRKLDSVAEERLEKIQGLERAAIQQKKDRKKAEEAWQREKQELQDLVTTTVEAKESALKDMTTAHAARKELQEHVVTLTTAADAERNARMENEIRAADTQRKADEDSRLRFERLQQQLKDCKEALTGDGLDSSRPVRETLILKDSNCSIEVNGYATEALGFPMTSLLSPSRLFQDKSQSVDADSRHYDRTWPRRERKSSFAGSSRSSQFLGASVASFSNRTVARQSQQMILFPFRPNADSVRLSELQMSLDRGGIGAVIHDQQDSDHGELILSDGGNTDHLVQSTVFWDAPILDLGSELLLTLKQQSWKPIYCRRSAGGRTYFLGDKPVHSYFFQDHYMPHFTPPASPTAQDAVIVPQAFVEEDALRELRWEFHLSSTGEYELDAGLTYAHIESLIARSFAKKEDHFRYRRQQRASQPRTPNLQTSFARSYPPVSPMSSTSRSSRPSSGASTAPGLSHDNDDDERFDTSQTSQADGDDGTSVYDADCDAEPSPSTPFRSSKPTNPFHTRRIQDGRGGRGRGQGGGGHRVHRTNPWATDSGFWDGESLI